MNDAHESEAGAACVAFTEHRLLFKTSDAGESTVVERLRRERVHIGMHATRPLDEQSSVWRHRDVIAKDVSKGGRVGAGRVSGLARLTQLLGIAQEYEACPRMCHR